MQHLSPAVTQLLHVLSTSCNILPVLQCPERLSKEANLSFISKQQSQADPRLGVFMKKLHMQRGGPDSHRKQKHLELR